jgi:predicted acetyltransferase
MTSPESRNQGLMSRLLYYAFIKMKRGNIALTTLIPQETWLIDYYKKFGYVSCFDQELKTVKSDNYPCFSDEMLFKEYQHSDLEDAYLFYSKHLENQSICIQKTLCDFSVMAEECQRFEGNVYLLVYQEEIVGIGFCFLTDDKIILKDFIAKDENFRQYFLAKLLQEWNKPIVISHSTQGMARILNAQMFLQLFAKSHPHLDFSVKVHDNHIDENNFTFFISKGTVIFRLTHTADFDLSIGGLTHLLLGRTDLLDGKYNLFPQQQPFMSLMLD